MGPNNVAVAHEFGNRAPESTLKARTGNPEKGLRLFAFAVKTWCTIWFTP
jgi:hypothetical protein